MRILLLTPSYAPRTGGLETVTRRLARHLAERGHAVLVVTNRYPRSLPAHEVRDGVQVQRLLFLTPRLRDVLRGRPDLYLAGLFYRPATAWRLRRLVETFRPEVVNLHYPDALVPFVTPLRRRHRFRLVVSLHGGDVDRYAAPQAGAETGPKAALAALLRQADAVTACSPYLLARAAGIEPTVAGKGTAITNGVDVDRFADAKPYVHPRPYILAVGRLVPAKGFDVLLEALALAAGPQAGVDLLLAGDGLERERLTALARERGLGGHVHFLGAVSAEEVARLVNGCRFVVVPSRAEGFGLVALEALAAAKPVLASRVGGMGDFLAALLERAAVGPENGDAEPPILLANPGDAADLAGGLRRALRGHWSAAAQQALQARIATDYSWDEAGRKYEHVLSGAAGPDAPGHPAAPATAANPFAARRIEPS